MKMTVYIPAIIVIKIDAYVGTWKRGDTSENPEGSSRSNDQANIFRLAAISAKLAVKKFASDKIPNISNIAMGFANSGAARSTRNPSVGMGDFPILER